MMAPSARNCLSHDILSKCALSSAGSPLIAMLSGYLTEFAWSSFRCASAWCSATPNWLPDKTFLRVN